MIYQTLRGKVALAAGATRGAGRGIAVELGAAGAIVYVTGRTTRTNARKLHVNRLKHGDASIHYLEGDEMRALRMANLLLTAIWVKILNYE